MESTVVGMEMEFDGEIFEWRGPAPFYYVALPAEQAEDLAEVAADLTYGWGVIPVEVRIGDTVWETSLFPKDGGYLVPIKVAVRRAEGLENGDHVHLTLRAGAR